MPSGERYLRAPAPGLDRIVPPNGFHFFLVAFAIINFDTNVVDTRSFARKLRFWGVFTVVYHERKVYISVRHVPRDVLTISLGFDLLETIHFLVKFGRIFEISTLMAM